MKLIKLAYIGLLASTLSQPTHSAEQAFLQQAIPTKHQRSQDIAQSYSSLESWLKSQITPSNLSVDIKDSAPVPNQQRSVTSKTTEESLKSPLLAQKQTSDHAPWQVRLASPDMITAWQKGQSPLFAYEPEGDEADWRYVEAFDVHGNTHLLDINQMPDRPVFVVEQNQTAKMQAGIKLANELLKQRQFEHSDMMQSAKTKIFAKSMNSSLSTSEPKEFLETTVLYSIQVEDIQEPWILGKAEVYALITGIDLDTDEAVLRLVDLPYLQEANQTYEPNQVVIQWGQYRWGAVDITLMEHDKNTDYKELASNLLNTASEIMKLIPSESMSSYIAVTELTNLIISAMPSHWLVNNDDYIDTFYTVLKDQEIQDRMGARGNAQAVFSKLPIPKN